MPTVADFYLSAAGEISGPYDDATLSRMMSGGQVKLYHLFAKVAPGVRPQKRDFELVSSSAMWRERHHQADEAAALLKEARERRDKIILTTESASALPIVERLGILTAECAYGMSLFKDFLTSVSDLVGGRSGTTQNVLRDAKDTVLADLRNQAAHLDADAVVAVDLDYTEFSGGGKSMLVCIGSGTAVKLANAPPSGSTANSPLQADEGR